MATPHSGNFVGSSSSLIFQKFIMLWRSFAMLMLCQPSDAFHEFVIKKKHSRPLRPSMLRIIRPEIFRASVNTSGRRGASRLTLTSWTCAGVKSRAILLTFALRNDTTIIQLLTEHRPSWWREHDDGPLLRPIAFTSPSQPFIMCFSCHKALPPGSLP